MICPRCKKRETTHRATPTRYGEIKVDGISEREVCGQCKDELEQLLPDCHTFYELKKS